MNLRYILLGLEYHVYFTENNELRYEFQQRTDFINNYFSKAIRRYKFETDGTFNMISIAPNENEIKPCSIVPLDVLEVGLPFDKKRYERIKGTDDYSYYLELLEQGFITASNFKSIPLETLLNLIEKFKQGGCKNEWLHKKKRFKAQDLEVILTCEFTTNYFQVVAAINQISSKRELAKGVVIKTVPDEVIFEGMYKDIIIDEDILITDRSDSPRVIINKECLFKGDLRFEIIGDEEIKKMLSNNL